MAVTSQKLKETSFRVAIFFLTSAFAVCFPLVVGKTLWPTGLSAGAEFIFWPATGVNVAFLLLFGWRYWPVILLDIFPVVLFLHGSWPQSVIGAIGNCIEALLTWWIVIRIGGFKGRFDRMRVVIALLLSALLAPAVGSLMVPAWLVYIGKFHIADFWTAVGNWSFSNGTAMLMLAPFIVAIRKGAWVFSGRWWQGLLWIVGGALCAAISFDAVFQEKQLNFTFIMFPFVILVALRFGPAETAGVLTLVMVSIYSSLPRYALWLTPAQTPATLWFVQTFCWVMAATALTVAALVSERRQAELHIVEEKSRNLEVSLREERARLDALRYQINPHFLFNALNSIRATLPLSEEVPRSMVTELADYLRTTLDHPEGDMASLREEIQSVERYLSIEKKRFGEDLQISISTVSSVHEKRVPVFLLQPLVENALRHGFETSKGRFYLKITAALSGSRLRIEVVNSGVWKDGEDKTRNKLGLENIRRRLHLLYGDRASLSLIPEDDWVCMRIELPMEEGT
ncbi:MAG: histidine kinase [Chthoniobacterales bacterium]